MPTLSFPRTRRITTFAAALLIMCALASVFLYISTRSANTTYFSKGSLAPELLTSWSTTRDGLGAPPPNFTTPGDSFVIQNTHNMTTIAAWSVGGTSGKLQIESGGTLTANAAVTVASASTFQIDGGGTYVHNNTGAPTTTLFQGTESFATTSNFEIRNFSTAAIPVVTGGFGNLTINAPSLTQSWNQTSNLTSVKGNFTIQATGGGTLEFRLANATDYTLDIGGNLTISGGILNISNGSSAAKVINLGGNFNQSGGTFTSGTGTTTVNFSGGSSFVNFTQSAGTLTSTNINWSIANGKTVQLNNAFTLPANRTFGINAGGMLLAAATFTNNGAVNVAGEFRLTDGGFANGANNFTYNGSTGTLGFVSSGSYVVNAAQTFWPATSGPTNVTVLGGGMTLNVARTVGGLVQTSAGITGAGNLTVGSGGTLQINTGGFFSGSPTYAANTLLKYNTGGTYGRNGEWLPGATSGAGYPANVQISNSTTLDLPNGSTGSPFQMAGSLTVDNGSKLQMAGTSPLTQPLSVRGNVTVAGNVELSTQIGGDLKVGGNYAAQNPQLTRNNRAVIFDGAAPQAITGAPQFDYLVVQNTSAAVTANGAIMEVFKDFTVAPGASFVSTFNGGTGFGTLNMKAGSALLNSGSVAADILFNNSSLNLSGVTVNQSLQMHAGSAVTGAGPTYGAGCTLLYTSGGTFNRGAEWSATSGAGYPANVRLQGNTTLSVGANGGSATARQISATLAVENGSVFEMGGASPMTAAVTVLGTLFNNGAVNLSTQPGGDLRVGGSINNAYLTPATPGTINGNGRRLHFVGGAAQTVTNGAAASVALPSLVVNKTGGSLQLSLDTTVAAAASGEGVSFQTAQSLIDLNGKTLTLSGGTFDSAAGSGFANTPGSLVVGGTGDAGTLPFVSAGTTLNNLTVNRAGAGGNVTVARSFTVSGALTLTAGTLNAGANQVAVGGSGTVARTNGYVIGAFQKIFGAPSNFTFPVGTANGYSPVDAASMTGTGALNVEAKQARQPNVAGAGALARHWALSGFGVTADLTFHYLDGDIAGDENNYKVFKYDGSFSAPAGQTLDAAANSATVAAVNSFSDWTLAEAPSVFGQIQFDTNAYTVGEPDGTVTLTVKRTGGTSGAVGFNYATADGTATAAGGSDYLGQTGTISWADGETADKTIVVTINNDAVRESATEDFTVTLSNPSGGATIGTPSTATVTINDDDAEPALSVSDVTMSEGNSGTTAYLFTVTKSSATALPVSVDFTTQDGTATVANGDYASNSGTLNFASNQPTQQFTVLVNGDTTVEPDEAFTVHLSNASGATISDADGTGTIQNDDVRPLPSVVYVDDSWAGTTAGADPDGAGPATEFGFDAFAAVQAGATGVASGGTVNVLAGSYVENVTIARPLTLSGAGESAVTIRPALSNPNCGGAGGGSLCAGHSTVILVQADGVTVTGLTLDGDNTSLTSGVVRGGADIDARNGIVTNHTVGSFSNLVVHHATVRNIYLRGVYNSTGGGFNFHHNTVSNVQGEAASIGLFNFGGAGTFDANNVSDCNDAIASNHSRGTQFTNNHVTGSASGIHTDNAGDQAGSTADTIANNTVADSTQFGYGIWVFVSTLTADVHDNTVTNTAVGYASAGSAIPFVAEPVSAARGLVGRRLPPRTGSRKLPVAVGVSEPESAFKPAPGRPEAAEAVGTNAPPASAANAVFTHNTADGQNRADSTGVYLTTDQFGFGTASARVDFNSNTVVDNADGFFLEAEATRTLAVQASYNRVVNNSNSAVSTSVAGTLSASMENNWWGCNAGPNNAGCGAVAAGVDFDPWLVLGVSASPNPIAPGAMTNVTADLTHNSAGADTSSGGFVPQTGVSFAATQGTVSPTSGTITNGQAATVFTSTSTSSGTASATVDNQTASTNVNVTVPAFSIDDVTANEGNSGTTAFTFTVTKTGATGFASSVDFATVDGTATTAGNDYATNSGTLNFASNEMAKQVTVQVNGDTSFEPNEAFTVHLSNASGATISDADGTGTIQNDDARPLPSVVYVDDDWAGTTAGADPDGAGPATEFGFDSFSKVQDGVNGVAAGGTVNVYAGTYVEDVLVGNAGLNLLGFGAGTKTLSGAVGGDTATVHVTASNVTVAGFSITRQGNNPTDWNNPGLNSAGIAIQGTSVTGALIRDNVLTGNRTGIDINNSNGHTVRNNSITDNRTGVVLRNQTDHLTVVENFITNNWTLGVIFLDASGGTNSPVQSAAHSTFSNNDLSGNWYGQVVDRQSGGSIPAPGTTNLKNFRGNWWGTTSPVVTTANSTEPGYAGQIPVAYGGSATPPGGQPDIAGPASANIKFLPLLLSGTDTNVETTPGRGTNGFQGVANTTVVRQSNAQGWVFFDDNPGTGTGTGGFEDGPGTPPLGAGSAFLQVDSLGRHALGNAGYAGTRMDDIGALSYASYQNNNSDPNVAISLQFDIDYDLNDAATAFMGRLVFEPYQTPALGAVQQNTWQTWDALAGKWYGTRSTVTAGNASVANPCQQATPCTWQQVLALFPNAGVRNTPTSLLLFKAGGPWAGGFDGNVDALRVSVGAAQATYDFEGLPTISISDVTMNEGDSGTTAFNFNVTLSRASAAAVTVDYATADGTATVADGDYSSAAGTVTFNPGETSKQVTVNVNGDATFEPDETFNVNLSNPNAEATVLDAQGLGTVTNDDAAPSFSINDVTANEGNSGTTTFTFTVTRTGATASASSVDFATVDGTATVANSDYASNSGTLNFASNETAKQVTVLVNGDTTVEPDETFTVHLSNASGATISDADGAGTIQNDDARPLPSVVYIDDDWAGTTAGADPDGAGPATEFGYDAFSKVQDGVNGVAAAGTVNVYAGTYDEDVNVNKAGLTVQGFDAGTKTVRGAIGGDAATFRLGASNVTLAGFTITRLGNNPAQWNDPGLNSAGVAIQGQAVTGSVVRDNLIVGNRTGIDINNSNGHTVRNNSVTDNRTGFIFRNQTDQLTVVENFITNNWTVGVLFLDGSGGTNSPVQSAAHSTFSNNDLSGNWYGQVVDRQSGGSIPAPNTTNLKNFRRNWWGTTSPVVTTANSAEPGYAAQIPVAYGGSATPPGGQPDIAGPASANIKFLPLLLSGTDTNVETAPGRGTNGFQGQQTPVLVWPPNQNGWTIQTSSTATAGFVEGPATPPLGVGSGRLSVGSDGDGAAQFRQSNFNGTPLSDLTALSYSSYTSNDGTAPAVGDQTVYVMLNVDLDGNGTNDTILFFEPEYQHGYTSAVPDQGDNVLNTWQTWDALHGGWWSTTGAAGANPGGDVKPLSDIVAAFPNARIHNSATSGSLRLVAGFGAGSWDNFVGNVDNVTVAVGLASATYDFEPLPALSIDDVTMNEGNTGTTPFTFTVTLSRAVDVPVTVDYSTADGTATAPADYAAAATTQLTFNPGETTKQVTVNVNGEDTFEPDETFFVNLSNASNATLLDAQGLGTITNDDTAPSFSINDVTMNEGDSGTTSFTFTVTKTGAGAASVDFATVDGTATVAGSDYQSNSGTLSFASGDATMTATVLVNGDTLYEADETFGVHLSNAVAAGISDADGTGTITNDDAPFTFSIDDVTMNEGDSGTTAFTFTVTKSGSAPLASSVNYATADGTAAAGSDYAAMSGTLNFASNETAKQVTVQVNGDTTPELDETFFVQLTAGSNASIADGSGTGTISNDDESVAAGQLIISEFRLRGPGNVSVVRPAGDEIPAAGGASSGGTTAASGGDDAPSTPGPVATSGGPQPNAVDATPEANDEFVELYNTTSSPLFVTTTDGSAGWTVAASGGTALFVIPNGTVIPARAHYLGANSGGYSLAAAATPDATWSGFEVPDNVGLALFRTGSSANYNTTTRLDAAGSTAEADALYREGAGYPALAPAETALNLEHSFYRSLCSFVANVGCTTPGLPKDSGDNAADFLFIDTEGTQTAAGKRLGTPGPENLGAPLQRNNAFGFALLDGTKSGSVAPNRSRDFTPGDPGTSPNGTLAIRRRVTNLTGAPVTTLRFRIIEMTTYPNPPGVADLRAITSSAASVSNIGDAATCGASPAPCTVIVEGTTLGAAPAQAQGGGFNSTLAAGTITLAEPLADGESISLQFVLGVVQSGTFRFLINIEALNPPPPARPAPGAGRR